jgi:hypothetical protein
VVEPQSNMTNVYECEYLMASQEEMLVDLESLGLVKPRLNSLNDRQEISNLIENIKQDYIREYHTIYNKYH